MKAHNPVYREHEKMSSIRLIEKSSFFILFFFGHTIFLVNGWFGDNWIPSFVKKFFGSFFWLPIPFKRYRNTPGCGIAYFSLRFEYKVTMRGSVPLHRKTHILGLIRQWYGKRANLKMVVTRKKSPSNFPKHFLYMICTLRNKGTIFAIVCSRNKWMFIQDQK